MDHEISYSTRQLWWNNNNLVLDTLAELTKEGWKYLGFTKTLFFLFFWVAHYTYYRINRKFHKQMQAEIDRISKDNREYREMFNSLTKDTLKLRSKTNKNLNK